MGSCHDREVAKAAQNEESEMTRTTVVIPNYNGMKYIDGCLQSLYRGTRIPEIIVVDNGSEDGSRELVSQKYEKVRLIEFDRNTGFSNAVNAGIKAASTEYVLLLNNDTEADGKMVENLEKALSKEPRAFSAGARMLRMDAPELLDGAGDLYCALGWAFARGKDRPSQNYDKPCRIFSACAGAAIYRKKVFDNIGYFDENHFAYLEDTDIGYRADIYGYYNIYTPEARVYHAGSAVSGSRHNDFKVRLSAQNSVYLIYKNMPFLQILLNMPFLLAGFMVKALFFIRKGMGAAYLKGIMEGLKLSAGPGGRCHKVRFSFSHMRNYMWVQGQLWINMVRRLL